MNLSYKPLVLAVGVLLCGTIKSMDRAVHPVIEAVEGIAEKLRRSGCDTLDDERYVATTNKDKIEIAQRIIREVGEKKLDLIDISNMQIVEDGGLVALVCLKVKPECRSHGHLQKAHIEQLGAIAEYASLSRDCIVLDVKGIVVLQDVVPINPYPYEYSVTTNRHGTISNTITGPSQLPEKAAQILTEIAGARALKDNNIEEEARDRILANLWRGRTQPCLQLALEAAAVRTLKGQ